MRTSAAAAAMSEAALVLEALEVQYAGVPAVRGVDLEVGAGEIVGLVGPNGAGKSSTLHAVMGVVAPAGGDVRVHGRSVRGLSPERVARLGVALVPEGRHIYSSLTVSENLRLGFAARRSRQGLAEDVAWVESLFPVIRDFRGRNAGALSGGQQQQLAIARALVARPDVLLLDEPSLGLAPVIVDRIYEVVRELNAQGVTILLVEQNANYALDVSARGYVLETGHVALTDTSDNLRNDERVQAAYLGA
jgi:branched-chain amino acid transport system ATP-binding protein